MLEHEVMVVGVVPAQLRDRAGLLAMAATLGANPCQVADRLDHWRFAPAVDADRGEVPRSHSSGGFSCDSARSKGLSAYAVPGWWERGRTTMLRATGSCRVVVVPDVCWTGETLADQADSQRFLPPSATEPGRYPGSDGG